MSWGSISTQTTVSTFDADVAAATEKYVAGLADNDYMLDQAALDQVAAATAAAKSLVTSGAVGDDTKRFAVSISGHANPGHVAAAGYANDIAYVNVAQATVTAPAT